MINIEPIRNTERPVKRNFDGIKLIVHKIKYTLDPGEWHSQDKTCHILAKDFKDAERLIVSALPKDKRFQISEMSDSFMEIHAISDSVKEKLYEILKPEFENKKAKLSDRLLRR
jgi:hypothetical protein